MPRTRKKKSEGRAGGGFHHRIVLQPIGKKRSLHLVIGDVPFAQHALTNLVKSGREGTTRFAHLWEMASGWTKEEEEEEKAHGDSLSLCQLPTLFALASLLKGSADRRRCGARGGTLPTLPPRSLSLPGTWRRSRPRGARWGICHDLKRKGGGKQKKEGRRQRLKARNKMEWEAREVF